MQQQQQIGNKTEIHGAARNKHRNAWQPARFWARWSLRSPLNPPHTHTHHAVCVCVCVHSPTPPYHLPLTYHVFFLFSCSNGGVYLSLPFQCGLYLSPPTVLTRMPPLAYVTTTDITKKRRKTALDSLSHSSTADPWALLQYQHTKTIVGWMKIFRLWKVTFFLRISLWVR
jgi:hypothetical protein